MDRVADGRPVIDVPGAKPKRKAAAKKPRKKEKRSVGFTMVADAHMRLHRSDFVAWLVLMLYYARVRRMPGGPARLDAGQCVCGSREIAARFGLDRGKVRRAIDALVNHYGFITVDPRARGTIVTIPFVADRSVATRNVGGDSHDPATRSRPDKRPTEVSTEQQHSANRDDPRNPATRSRPAKRPLTETGETGETGVGAARNSINGRSEEIDELHAYLEKRRRRVLGKAYRPLPRSAVAGAIAERLAEGYSVKHCKLVVDADASEVAGGGKARHFGPNTFSANNTSIKLPDAIRSDETRRAREREERAERNEQPPKQRFYVAQRNLDALARFRDSISERDVLIAHYDRFPREFHEHKRTWSEVKRLWDGENRQWFQRVEATDG